MKKSTEELLETLKSNNLDTYLTANDNEMINFSLSDYLNQLMKEKKLKKSVVIEKSNIFNVYAYQIFSGKKMPSRDKLISLCFGMKLTLDEAQTLLKYTGFARLYPRSKRDSAIIYALENKKSIIDCNIKLDELGLSLL